MELVNLKIADLLNNRLIINLRVKIIHRTQKIHEVNESSTSNQ